MEITRESGELSIFWKTNSSLPQLLLCENRVKSILIDHSVHVPLSGEQQRPHLEYQQPLDTSNSENLIKVYHMSHIDPIHFSFREVTNSYVGPFETPVCTIISSEQTINTLIPRTAIPLKHKPGKPLSSFLRLEHYPQRYICASKCPWLCFQIFYVKKSATFAYDLVYKHIYSRVRYNSSLRFEHYPQKSICASKCPWLCFQVFYFTKSKIFAYDLVYKHIYGRVRTFPQKCPWLYSQVFYSKISTYDIDLLCKYTYGRVRTFPQKCPWLYFQAFYLKKSVRTFPQKCPWLYFQAFYLKKSKAFLILTIKSVRTFPKKCPWLYFQAFYSKKPKAFALVLVAKYPWLVFQVEKVLIFVSSNSSNSNINTASYYSYFDN